MKPKAIDLYCGLGGWTRGLLAEGWDVVGFDIERHRYGGSQFRDVSLIVASSPCQEFSYRAMPWKRAKALGPPLLGMELFAQAERIQREAIVAAGRFIPMVQENVRGAQKYVGRARWHYGSFYLWGDVPALMPITFKGVKVGGSRGDDWFAHHNRPEFEDRVTKNSGGSWFRIEHGRSEGASNDPRAGVKQDGGKSSARSARQAASARIAEIPLPLACHIAATYYLRGTLHADSPR